MEYPLVSLITSTYNNPESLKILYECYKLTDYPRDKLEWIILDDGDKSHDKIFGNDKTVKYYYIGNSCKSFFYNKMKKKEKKIMPKHKNHFYEYRLPKGMKYNILCHYSSHNIIMHFEEDCFYLTNHIKLRLEKLQNCVSSNIIGTFCTYKPVSMVNNRSQKTISNRKTFSECLAYTKQFWIEKKFNNQDIENISFNFLKKRIDKVNKINGIKIVVFLLTENNKLKNKNLMKLVENSDENGWHFGKLDDKLFLQLIK